jgi:adenine-specific DNA-methyltransferase
MSRAAGVPPSCKVSTPAGLAQAMVLALGARARESWLDPCTGAGVFPQALKEAGVPVDQITALDLERERHAPKVPARVTWGEDFLIWAQRTRRRFDNIIANPPYIAISQLPDNLRSAALVVTSPGGGKMPRRANYWYAFLCASFKLLRNGGNLCFVLPSAWDYAEYAASLRREAPKLFARFHVHRCERPLFDSVLDGCIVVVGYGYRKNPQEHRRFSHDSAEALLARLKKELNPLGGRRSFVNLPRQARSAAPKQRLLGDLLEIRLGGVTGDARYFLLTEARRRELELPVETLRPALSRAGHLVAGRVTKKIWGRLLDAGDRVWLFDPSDEYLQHPAVQKYLNLDERCGGCRRTRYKINSRTPWHRTRLPDPVDGFLSGMTRRGPWLCFSGMPSLTASNTLYTFRFKEDLEEAEKVAWALALLDARDAAVTRSLGRRYADGLIKYEPGDLYKIPLTVPSRIGGSLMRYEAAVEEMLRDVRSGLTASAQLPDRRRGRSLRTSRQRGQRPG